MGRLVTKDFYKTDIYRFDIESNSGNMFDLDVGNVISWDIMSLKMTKEDLVGLADFLNQFVEEN